jgi:hypothetical protein
LKKREGKYKIQITNTKKGNLSYTPIACDGERAPAKRRAGEARLLVPIWIAQRFLTYAHNRF